MRAILFVFIAVMCLEAQPKQIPLYSPPPAKNLDELEGVYRVGASVTAPVLIERVEPEYSEEARKAKVQGEVWLEVVVDETGALHNIKVTRKLGLGLDEKAIEAVKKWKFKPGTKDGKAVVLRATIAVTFALPPEPPLR